MITTGNGQYGKFSVARDTSSALHFGWVAMWSNESRQHRPSYYAVTGKSTGLPAGAELDVLASSLATPTTVLRAGPEQSILAAFTMRPRSGQCIPSVGTGLSVFLPGRVDAHVSPGTWALSASSSRTETDTVTATLAARSRRAFQLYNSVWGPHQQVVQVRGKRVTALPDRMFRSATGAGQAAARTTTTLSRSGKVLAQRTTVQGGLSANVFNAPLTGAGWYTLTMRASRVQPYGGDFGHPAEILSTASALSVHFYADPRRATQVPFYAPVFKPTGLDARNHAKSRSTTAIPLGMEYYRSGDTSVAHPKDAVKSVRVWVSYNDGKTWHAVTVKHTGSSWTAYVHNPASGTVSLRSTVVDSHGNSATSVVTRAYGVG